MNQLVAGSLDCAAPCAIGLTVECFAVVLAVPGALASRTPPKNRLPNQMAACPESLYADSLAATNQNLTSMRGQMSMLGVYD